MVSLPMPGPRKYCLGDNCAGEQRPKLQPDNGEDRDHRVAQSVAIYDGALRQAFGARGADVILPKLFQHRGPYHPRKDGRQRSAHGDGRKHEMRQRAGA